MFFFPVVLQPYDFDVWDFLMTGRRYEALLEVIALLCYFAVYSITNLCRFPLSSLKLVVKFRNHEKTCSQIDVLMPLMSFSNFFRWPKALLLCRPALR